MLLLSRYVLDYAVYDAAESGVTWETCSLREWLNETFYREAFSDAERQKIAETENINTGNSAYKTPDGNNTWDRVFCLSNDEVLKYFTFETWDESMQMGYSIQLMGTPTAYAIENGVSGSELGELTYEKSNFEEKGYGRDKIGSVTACWYLRSVMGYKNDIVGCVGYHGHMGIGSHAGTLIGIRGVGVRPAIWVNQ